MTGHRGKLGARQGTQREGTGCRQGGPRSSVSVGFRARVGVLGLGILLFTPCLWLSQALAKPVRSKRGYRGTWTRKGGRRTRTHKASGSVGLRPASETRRFGAEGRSGRTRHRSVSSDESARRARVAARAVSRALARFAWEPSVRDVQRRALAFADLQGGGITKSRIRGAAALPELRIGVDLGRLQTSTSRQETGSPVRLTQRLDADRAWSLEARWRLHRLIFDPNELKLQAQRLRREDRRDEILAHVTRLYFLRRRLQALEILQPARSLRTALARRLAIQRLTGELDGLTGGWFSEMLRKRASRR